MTRTVEGEVDLASFALVRTVAAAVAVALGIAVTVRPRTHAQVGTPRGRVPRRRWAAAAVLGAAIAAGALSLQHATGRLDVGSGSALELVGPLLLAVAACRATRIVLPIACSALGVALLAGLPANATAARVTWSLVASGAWALALAAGRRMTVADDGRLTTAAGLLLALGVAVVVLAPFGLAGVGGVLGSARLTAGAVVAGVVSVACVQAAWLSVLGRTTLADAASLTPAVPLISFAFAAIVLGERLTAAAVCGAALIAVALAWRSWCRAGASA